MKKEIELEIGGIKCDNVSCDYANDTVTFEEFPVWINKPCPKCGDNLLTLQDYINVIKIITAIEELNATDIPESGDGKMYRAEIETHGTISIKNITEL